MASSVHNNKNALFWLGSDRDVIDARHSLAGLSLARSLAHPWPLVSNEISMRYANANAHKQKLE